MDKKIKSIKLYYDSQGNTLNVWFDDPEKEHICEETGEEIIIVKDKQGKVIGFEKLNYLAPNLLPVKSIPVEMMLS